VRANWRADVRDWAIGLQIIEIVLRQSNRSGRKPQASQLELQASGQTGALGGDFTHSLARSRRTISNFRFRFGEDMRRHSFPFPRPVSSHILRPILRPNNFRPDGSQTAVVRAHVCSSFGRSNWPVFAHLAPNWAHENSGGAKVPQLYCKCA